jgi:hypothetical protein
MRTDELDDVVLQKSGGLPPKAKSIGEVIMEEAMKDKVIQGEGEETKGTQATSGWYNGGTQATSDAQARSDAQATSDAQVTSDTQATSDAQPVPAVTPPEGGE